MPRKRKRPLAYRCEPALDALPNIAWVCDRGGELVFANQAARTYLGVTLDDLLGWAWADVIHPADQARMMAAWAASVETGRRFRAEYRLRRHDGTTARTAGSPPAVTPSPGVDKWSGSGRARTSTRE